MSLPHCVVWVDHQEARIFEFSADALREGRVLENPHAGSHRGEPRHDDAKFYASIESALGDASEILLTGPGTAKSQLLHHLEAHAPRLRGHVVAMETVDHPTDRELVAHARKHFHESAPRVR